MAENFTAGETVPLAAGTSSTSVSFSLSQSAAYPDCLVVNTGSQLAFVGFGSGAQVQANAPGAGAVNAVPVLPGEALILRKGVGNITCSALSQSGSTTLYFTAGQGN